VAIHTHPVIARSKATWQSIFQAVPDARWIASPSARNDGGVLAVILIPVIARSKATWQSIPTLSLRGAQRRGNPHPPCHCEEQSDVAIHISGSAGR